MTFVPVLFIVVALAAVGAAGFDSSREPSREQVENEVTELLDGIPQKGPVLGSSKAPITVWMFADLECRTVKLLVENYLSPLIEDWVRPGTVKLVWRSLETDTSDEEIFFKQEVAALAAGRQDKMWNFALTFVREQGEPPSAYVTAEFLDDIASQVPALAMPKWHSDRADARLSKRVALGVYSGHAKGLRYTPSFLIGFTEGDVERRSERASLANELNRSLGADLTSLQEEATEDFPAVKVIDPSLIGG